MVGIKFLSFRLDSKLREGLDRLAKTTNRSRSSLVEEAIRGFVDLNNWQIAETQKGMREANNGEFVTDADISRIRKKWTRPAAR